MDQVRLAPSNTDPLPDLSLELPAWHADAACRDTDPSWWFSGRHVEDAKAVCADCLVVDSCLEFAQDLEGDVSRNYRAGIWGGLTVDERVRLARQPAA